MIPKSLSASSAQVFEACPARWKVEYLDKTPSPSGDAANLGTACHGTAERWVTEGWYENRTSGFDPVKQIRKIYEEEYRKVFAHDGRYQEGIDLMLKWLDRQDWVNRVVLSTEVKKSFDLPTSAGPIPFNYIMDRLDLLEGPWSENGELHLEVVDYKTVGLPVQPEQLKKKIQARCYALAAQLEYPDADRIWVTFDLLRYDAVGTVFTKEENRETWKYLRALAERVIADETAPEQLGPDCRWCLRKHECETLTQHAAVGGVLGITDPVDATERRANLDSAKRALETMIDELDTVILEHCEREGLDGFETENVEVELTASKRREVDTAMAARIIGPDLVVGKGAKLPISAVDDLLKKKDSPLSAEQKSQLRQLVRTNWGNVRVVTKPKNPLDQ